MNGIRKLAAISLLSAAMVASGPVQAVEFRQFDEVADQDRGAYAGPPDQSTENVLPGEDNGHVSNSARKPMVTQNPDGTFTIQKEPSNGNSKDATVKDGLVIRPQVVVPIFLTPQKKQ